LFGRATSLAVVSTRTPLTYADIEPVTLTPADAAAAFARGSIDAWTIWDPRRLGERDPLALEVGERAEARALRQQDRRVGARHPRRSRRPG
jgi:hypothetical protein